MKMLLPTTSSIALQEPKTVVFHLASLYGKGNNQMAPVIQFVQKEAAGRKETVTWDFIKKKANIAWNNGIAFKSDIQQCGPQV